MTDDSFHRIVDAAAAAAPQYANCDGSQRSDFLIAIATALEASADDVVATADRETHLGTPRLTAELSRTTGQLRLFAELVRDGSWAGARIDTGPPDVRRMLVPLGPVAVFGASNFPLAFSVPGGDTASALAAGCPVVCKTHPAHPETSSIAARAIQDAVRNSGLPAGVFGLIEEGSIETGRRLVADDRIEAVGFTGSLGAGRALFDIAAARPRPIPVYAEMGSVNPVFVLPEAAAQRGAQIAAELADSIKLGVGQFCTKPGVVVTCDDAIAGALGVAMTGHSPATMLTATIATRYAEGVSSLLASGATLLAGSPSPGQPALVRVDAETFISDPALHDEVFGPVGVIVEAPTSASFLSVAETLDGQLTATVYATEGDLANHRELVNALTARVGRLIANGVPTGVTVTHAMHHGGPYPASTDSRVTSVGTAAIERFVRPICYQNFPDSALPPLLRDSNPVGALRMINGSSTRRPHRRP